MTPSPRKAELLDAVLEDLVAHGVANTSLRPMAARLGTSPRMLMFHFTSKEELLREALEALHARLQASLARMATRKSNDTAPLRQFWDWATQPKNLPYLRLIYETQMIAAANPKEFGHYLRKTSSEWHASALRAMSESLKNDSLATLCIAVFDGLFLELVSGGDHRRLTGALDEFIRMARAYAATKAYTVRERPDRPT
jgi:AcrR family transcriptional regulator